MALNSALITSAYNFAVDPANRVAVMQPNWISRNGFAALTYNEDRPELRRQLNAVRHVVRTSAHPAMKPYGS